MATIYGSWSSRWKPSGASEYRHFRSVLDYTITVFPTYISVYVKSGINLDYTVNAGFYVYQTDNSSLHKYSKYDDAKTYWWQSRTYTFSRKTSAYNASISVSCKNDGDVSAWNGDVSYTSASFVVPALDTYTLSFDATGGTDAPSSQTGFYNTAFAITQDLPTFVAHEFVIWEDRSTTPYTYYLPNQNISLTENKTLYAVWEDVGISPTLDYDSLSDTKMTKWTSGHSIASVTINSATVQSEATLSKITLSLTNSNVTYTSELNSPFTFPNSITLNVPQAGEYSVLLTATDSLGYSKVYQLATINVIEPTYTPNNFSIEGTFPSVDQDGFAIVTFYAKNYSSDTYEVLTGNFIPTAVDNTHWTVELSLPEKYIGSGNAIDVKAIYSTSITSEKEARKAFYTTTRQANYSNGLANNIFVGGSKTNTYTSRVWYSALNNPLYFPDTNYIEVGSNDTSVMGLIKVGDYLGVIKQSKPTDTSIYLVYPTSFDDNTTYAIKQSIGGVGAASKYCFNVLGDETLFLSDEGIMAIETGKDDQHKIQLRSFYINKKLLSNNNLEDAYSFVWNGMYIIAIDNECYILHGDQKTAWETSETDLQYEAYYWDNIPAKCFMKYYKELWFCDDQNVYAFGGSYADNGVPIVARWSTILDNDGASQYFKTLQKKGNVITLLADENGTSANVYFKQDNQEEVLVKELDSVESDIPIDIFPKKKMKKYKRLQIIVENNKNESFGVSEIVKSYTLGNYAK